MNNMKKTLAKILSVTFCIAVFLGLLDAIVSLSNHLAEKTANAGELDVQSVQEATEIFINKNGTLESYTKNQLPEQKLPIQNAVISNDEFTPVEIKNSNNFTPPTTKTNTVEEFPLELVKCPCGTNCKCSPTNHCGCFAKAATAVKAAVKPAGKDCCKPCQCNCGCASCKCRNKRGLQQNSCNSCKNNTGNNNYAVRYGVRPVRNFIRRGPIRKFFGRIFLRRGCRRCR